MKIYKYQLKDISTGIHLSTVEYLIFESIKEVFNIEAIKYRVHTSEDNTFFFIAEKKEQDEMIKVFSNVDDLKHLGDFETTYEDMTDEIFNNIDNYDSIENFNDRNTILEYYKNVFTPDAILDKIIEKGINSLSNRDKLILQESVK